MLCDSRCECGCTGVKHVAASFGGRAAPTYVLLHTGTQRFVRVHDPQRPEEGVHDMTNEELQWTFCLFDTHEVNVLPQPRQLDLVLIDNSEIAERGTKAMRDIPSDSGVYFPTLHASYKQGCTVRHGDRIVVAVQNDDELTILWLRVVGVVSAMSLIVAKAEATCPELQVQAEEAISLSESNLLLVCHGSHWSNLNSYAAERRRWAEARLPAFYFN